LKGDQVIDVNQVVPQGHLVLFFGLIEVTIKHLQDGILGIDLSIVVLLVNLNLLLQRFSFGETQPLAPLSQNLHPIQVGQALLLNHLRLQVVPPQAHHLLLFFEIFVSLLLVADSDHLSAGFLPHDLAFYELAELGHPFLQIIQISINYQLINYILKWSV